jgi:hypothetical protein
LGAVAAQEEEVVGLMEVAVVLVGSSSGPPTQSPLVPPTQWWWARVELDPGLHLTPPHPQRLVATHPLDLILPWWPLVEEQATASTHHTASSMEALVEEALPSLLRLALGWAHQAKVRLADGRHV